jgi:hypothetical protein
VKDQAGHELPDRHRIESLRIVKQCLDLGGLRGGEMAVDGTLELRAQQR